MGERKSFLVRLDAELLDELRRWADADLRSLNGQIEFLLRKALSERHRTHQQPAEPEPPVKTTN